jgi:tetratricopeptide (TPR) repeat protein
LGEIQLEKQDWQNTINTFSKVIELDPFNPDAWENIGQCYANLGNLQEASIAYEKSIQLGPYNAQAWIDLGILYEKMAKHDLARSACERGLSFNRASNDKQRYAREIINHHFPQQ